jgi:hypothetical protein
MCDPVDSLIVLCYIRAKDKAFKIYAIGITPVREVVVSVPPLFFCHAISMQITTSMKILRLIFIRLLRNKKLFLH